MELVQQEWASVRGCYVGPGKQPAEAPILRAQRWPTNGHMIADVHRLGYITDDDVVLDPTYGQGTWWSVWRPTPSRLYAMTRDMDLEDGEWDFRAMPEKWTGIFDVVAFDPPYQLRGSPSQLDFDVRYGVDVPMTWPERHAMMTEGMAECIRVLKSGGILLMKCQDQVVSGKVRWQTRIFADEGERLGCELVDRLDFLSYRAQPPGRAQVHARSNYSTLLVFRKARGCRLRSA